MKQLEEGKRECPNLLTHTNKKEWSGGAAGNLERALDSVKLPWTQMPLSHCTGILLLPVLIGPGCCNKISLGNVDRRLVFSPVLEAGSPGSGCRCDWLLGRPLFLGCRWLNPQCPQVVSPWCVKGEGEQERGRWKRERRALGFFLIRTGMPVEQGPALMTSSNLNYLPKAQSPSFTTLGIRASAYEFDTNVQFLTQMCNVRQTTTRPQHHATTSDSFSGICEIR